MNKRKAGTVTVPVFLFGKEEVWITKKKYRRPWNTPKK